MVPLMQREVNSKKQYPKIHTEAEEVFEPLDHVQPGPTPHADSPVTLRRRQPRGA
jgi:hypothetical protein